MPNVRENRLALIRALESGEFAQARHQLAAFSFGVHRGYCCIGVQRHLATGETYWIDEMAQYSLFSEDVDIDSFLTDYLMGMNDGTTVYRADGNGTGPTIRNTIAVRNFSFIARYLRKVWRLTDVR